MPPGLPHTLPPGPHSCGPPARWRRGGAMIATGPPQSAIWVVSNSRSAATSDRSGRSMTSLIVHCSGCDLLTRASSGWARGGHTRSPASRSAGRPFEDVGREGPGRDAAGAPVVQPGAHLVQPVAQGGHDRLLGVVGAVFDTGPDRPAPAGQGAVP